MLFSTELHQNIYDIIEVLGTIAFAMSGAFAAMQKRLDPFGVLIIAFATAVGGGTIRDLLLDMPVFWMTDMNICFIIFISCIVSMIFKSLEHNFKVTLFIFDSLGLGLFTLIGVLKGMSAGLNPVICVTLGTITGCFGGVLRDVLINRIPLLLREEIYATACIAGGLLYVIMNYYLPAYNLLWQFMAVGMVFFIRHISVKYHLQLPKFYLSSEEKMKKHVEKLKKRKK